MSTAPNSRPLTDLEAEMAAMVKGVNALDVGRRVGWARAYAAEASKDELSRENNMLRSDRDIMIRATSFLYGYVTQYAEIREDQEIIHSALGQWSRQVGAILETGALRAGREAAAAHLNRTEVLRERKARKEASTKAHDNIYKAGFRHGRLKQLDRLVHEFGFANEAALYNYLTLYPGGTDAR